MTQSQVPSSGIAPGSHLFTRTAAASRGGSSRHAAPAQVLVLFALSIFVLVGVLALSIDAGFLLAERRQVQSAADAGALAAASALQHGDDVDESALSYAMTNAGVPAEDVTISEPPLTGRYAGRAGYIQVTVHKDVPKFFVGAIYAGGWTATASAVAAIESVPVRNYALITLDRQREPGIRLNGNTSIIVNGDYASAMSNTTIAGSPNTTFQVTGSIDAHGVIQPGRRWNEEADLNAGLPQMDDPLEWMSPPGRGPERTFPDCRRACTLEPGYYRDQQLTVGGAAMLRSGIYVFEDVTITLQNTMSKLHGEDVLLHFTGESVFDPKNGDVDVRASGRQDYEDSQPGLVFWFDSCSDLDLQGNGNLFFEGIVYAPCSHVTMHGNPAGEVLRGQMIVGVLDIRGTSDLVINHEPWVTAPRPTVFLVE